MPTNCPLNRDAPKVPRSRRWKRPERVGGKGREGKGMEWEGSVNRLIQPQACVNAGYSSFQEKRGRGGGGQGGGNGRAAATGRKGGGGV